MKIYAVTNIKGGVGKTTTAVNLAYLCAAAGTRTLLWDLDSQGGATYVLRGEPQAHASAKKLLAGKRELPELIAPTGYPGLELLPADFSYRNFAVQLAERRHPTERLLKMSRSLRQIYGALFLDCPAGMSLLSENVLRAADVVIVPLVPSPLSIRMLRELYAFMAAEGWSDLRVAAVLFHGRPPPLVAPGADDERARGVSGHPRHRGAVPQRDRAHDRAACAAGGRGAASEAALIYRQLWQEIVQQGQPASAAAPARAAEAHAVPARRGGTARSIPEVPPSSGLPASRDGAAKLCRPVPLCKQFLPQGGTIRSPTGGYHCRVPLRSLPPHVRYVVCVVDWRRRQRARKVTLR